MDKFFNKFVDVLKGYIIVMYLHRLYIMVTAVSRRSIIYQAGCLYKSCLEMMSRRDNSVNIKHWYTVIQPRKLWRNGISSLAVIEVNLAVCMYFLLVWVYVIFNRGKPQFPWVFECMRNGDLLVLYPQKKNQADLQTQINQECRSGFQDIGHSSLNLSLKIA